MILAFVVLIAFVTGFVTGAFTAAFLLYSTEEGSRRGS